MCSAPARKELGLWEPKPWGDIIEDRGSQITFSALGQAAPPEAKYALGSGRLEEGKLREYAAARLPELEVRGGGSTSIDVTRKGIDKAYGMGKLMQRLGLHRRRRAVHRRPTRRGRQRLPGPGDGRALRRGDPLGGHRELSCRVARPRRVAQRHAACQRIPGIVGLSRVP